eukprot:CAMPEP_0178945622 /NCGR_PEP_ID=MMETSP0789-20121207/3834_1 /TAXON_ID=3005 /ORGANISM="Rhizosolenia setigera, Strain CCMP 1694" /LENGTH=95 /DNA_ID=CAMNT_0020625527 /DNA_START=210 /DNA_END=497 /DNA_ORIENTATION=+
MADPKPDKEVETVASNTDSQNNATSTITWKLPDGIEEHIYDGLVNSALGIGVGGISGLGLLRSASGGKIGMAMGLGVAVGSTVERALNEPHIGEH